MSNLMGSGVQIFGRFDRLCSIAPAYDALLHQQCEKQIEKSAAELESLMKRMIQGDECGLAKNGDLTLSLKGGSTPLVDNGHLLNGISSKKIEDKVSAGGSDRTVTSYFVGIQRNAGLKMPSSHLGKYVPVALYTIARNQVLGYTVTLPKNGIKKKVPKRDFRKPVKDAFKDKFKEDMADAAVTARGALVSTIGSPL